LQGGAEMDGLLEVGCQTAHCPLEINTRAHALILHSHMRTPAHGSLQVPPGLLVIQVLIVL
jgi:hypothetical protein